MNPGAAAEPIEIEVRLRADGGLAMARDIRLGLTAKPKELAPKYFYDERGSQLFEQITELPEYYPTRAEREILAQRSAEIVAAAGEPGTLVELGSGSAAKTRHLLSAMRDAGCLATYVHCRVAGRGVPGPRRSRPGLRLRARSRAHSQRWRRPPRRLPRGHDRQPLSGCSPGLPRPHRGSARTG
jgi:L-histidine N-alpha-methyltransferase